ncbi:MAG: S-layer homology domain-containing protein [Armatimonadota bacterium]
MKRLLIGLGVAIAMTFAGNAWAQVPPDVPPGHWAYDAIEELVNLGVLKGYPDGTFKGKAPMTRYEFAIAIRDALAAVREEIEEVRRQIPGVTPTPPAPQPQPQRGEVYTAEEKAKLGKIPADTADRLQKLEDAMAQIRRLATEFQDEVASLGVDVESAKRDLASLRRRIEAIEEELKRVRITGDVTFVVRGTNSIDNNTPAVDLNAQPTAPGGLLGNLDVLHELGLNISSKLGETASADVSLVVGNWLPYLGSASQFVAPTGTNTDIVLWKAAVNAPISILGTEVDLTIGRFENRISPLTLWRPDVDVYTTIDRYDSGYYSMDGAKASIGFGSVQIGLFAARNSSVTTNNGGNFMSLNGGIGATANVAVAHPATGTVAGIGAFDNSAGATVEVSLGEKVSLSGEFVTAKRGTINVAPFGNANRLNVYGGHLKANLIDRLAITADYAQSDLLLQASNVNNKDNWALLVGLGYTFSDNLLLKAGYREVRPYFAAPGYWGRIGYWHNPTDIKGVDVAVAWKLGSLAVDAKGGFYKGSNRPASFVGKDDEITHIAAGVAWNASEKLNLNVSYEGVLWNLKTSGGGAKPVENYVTLGLDYKVGDNALLKLLYQVVDFDYKNVTGWLGGGKAKAGVAVAQFGVKF